MGGSFGPDHGVVFMSIEYWFQVLLCGVGSWFLYEFRAMRLAIESINVRLGALVEKTNNNERRIDFIEKHEFAHDLKG